MGRKAVLGCMEKRDIFNKTGVSREDLLLWGDDFLEEGALSDAIDFYARANSTGDDSSSSAREALEKIRNLAMEEGDLFLFTKVSRALAREPDPDELKSLAEHAGRLGKELYAAQALARAGLNASPEGHSTPS